MASLTSLASVSIELSTPIQQLDELMKNSENESLVETAKKIKVYLGDGKKIEEVVAAMYLYYDKMLLFTITNRLNGRMREQFRKDIQSLLRNMYGAQHPETLSIYEVAEIDVRKSLRDLGEQMRALVLTTYEKNPGGTFLKIEDGKDAFD